MFDTPEDDRILAARVASPLMLSKRCRWLTRMLPPLPFFRQRNERAGLADASRKTKP